ncbi:hypothetical protein M2408_000649 [Sphingobacterium sp. BIGb0165]|nr:hypothetical protein [Sphingobacterium sp. BIGb0165]
MLDCCSHVKKNFPTIHPYNKKLANREMFIKLPALNQTYDNSYSVPRIVQV